MHAGLRAVLLRQFGRGLIRMKKKRKKEKGEKRVEKRMEKVEERGVSQSPLEFGKLAGDNGVVIRGKSSAKASVRVVLGASGQIERDGRSLRNGLKLSGKMAVATRARSYFYRGRQPLHENFD